MASPVEIQPARPADVDGLIDLFMQCFNDEYFNRVFPPSGPGQAYMRKAWTSFIQPGEGTQEARVSVVKNEDGQIIAGLLLWVVKAGEGGAWPWTKRWPGAEEGMDDALLEEFFSGMAEQHDAAMGTEPHIYLEIVFTHPSARRRGIAASLVAHAAAVADALDVEVYLDAEGKAVGIYQRSGFVLREDVARTSEVMVSMTRPRKSAV